MYLVDILDQDACHKLEQWFNSRWEDDLFLDISNELVDIIHDSWARPELIPPYYIYLKAVKIAAHHLNKRNGVLIGDVVGLGKTLMATALARIFDDHFGLESLILCPKNPHLSY